MADYMLLGLFDDLTRTNEALEDLRELGLSDKDITLMSHVPYSPKFFGRPRPRSWFLPFVVAGALGGALVALFITVGTTYLYPLHVGGQPLVPFPPSAIMYFEFIALGIMVSSFIGFLLQNRFPILVRQMYDERITDGYIGLAARAGERLATQIEGVFQDNGAIDIRREDAGNYRRQGIRHLIFWGILGGGVGTAGLIPLLLTYNIVRLPWINVMDDSPAVGYQEGPRLAAPAESIPVQGPSLINGVPASVRLEDTDVSRQRGQMLYSTFCEVCHGAGAAGDSAFSRKYFQDAELFPRGVPALAGRGLPPEYIFVTATNGVRRGDLIVMPAFAYQLTPGETWDIVNYILSLEAAQPEASAAGQ